MSPFSALTTNGEQGAPAGKYKATVSVPTDSGESDPTKAAAADTKGVKSATRHFDSKYEDAGKTTLTVDVAADGKGSYELKLTR